MNPLHENRQRVRHAAARLSVERDRFKRQTAWLRDGFERYRPIILLGGGFGAGLLLGRSQLVQATRSIRSISSLGFGLMRSSLGSMLVAAALRGIPHDKHKPAPAAQQVQG